MRLDVVTSSEIARMLGVSKTYVNRLALQGDLPKPDGILDSGQRIWLRQSIKRWEAGRRSSPARRKPAAGKELPQIRRRGFLRVGISLDVPQLAARDDFTGEYTGFEIHLARKLARVIFECAPEDAANHLEFNARDVNALFEHLVDVVLVETQSEIGGVRPVGDYLQARHALLMNTDSPPINELADLSNVCLASVAASTGEAIVREHLPRCQTIAYETAQACVDAMRRGEADAAWLDTLVIRAYASGEFSQKTLDVEPKTWAFAVREPAADLAQLIDKMVGELRASGELDAIKQRWIGASELN